LKLKYVTKVFIAVNTITIVFRTLQIMFLTESGSAFLKDGFYVLNIIAGIVIALLIAYNSVNSFFAVRQPARVRNSGKFGFVVSAVTGLFYIIGGATKFGGNLSGWQILFLMSLAAAFACFLFAASAISEYVFPKIAALAFISLWLTEFVLAYNFYKERALRVRTIYEAFALFSTVLFFICLGKAYSGVSASKNFRFLYPLGLLSSTLCFASVVPEFIALVCGFSKNISPTSVSSFALFGAGLFIAYVTLSTFSRSNTRRLPVAS
jgi:hypothetical protein